MFTIREGMSTIRSLGDDMQHKKTTSRPVRACSLYLVDLALYVVVGGYKVRDTHGLCTIRGGFGFVCGRWRV